MNSSRSSSTMESLVSNIVRSKSTQSLLHAYGLEAMNISWDDTGRNKNSCLGPNISDMTLAVYPGSRMPVIRKPNFSDITHDLPIESFKLNVGDNRIVSLKDYLSDLSKYTDNTKTKSVLCERDSVVLTSAQCCVLPVSKGDKTEFTVQLYNYQSYEDDPAVLVILATKDGTSAQIVNSSNTKLLFNKSGTAHWLSVERLEDSRERRGEQKTRVDSFKEMKESEKLENTILMIQVPLVVKERPRKMYGMFGSNGYGMNESMDGCMEGSCGNESFFGETLEKCSYKSMNCSGKKKSLERGFGAAPQSRGMDMGQVGLGRSAGSYTGTKNLQLIRDERFPIRVTCQFYRVTDTDNISEKDVKDIAEQLNTISARAVNSGSLVITPDSDRKTEPQLKPVFTPSVSNWGDNSMTSF